MAIDIRKQISFKRVKIKRKWKRINLQTKRL